MLWTHTRVTMSACSDVFALVQKEALSKNIPVEMAPIEFGKVGSGAVDSAS